ncbi:MAG TPA: IS200/IS605 family transposase [Chitinophagales bacterium]|nr:IS200/IS605 family transposase [Chitinophagales bacterium]
MSFVRIMVHAVWGTKNRTPFLKKEIRSQLIGHIRENAKVKEIYIDKLNGYTEHLHCLFALNANLSLAKTMQLLKGESAFWMNKQKLLPVKFEWADEYFAVSVSESMMNKVRNYIDNQEEHHKKLAFAQEYDEFIKKYNFKVYHG